MIYYKKRQSLNNEIHKVNQVRKIVNKVVPMVLDELRPFVGQKIMKVDESLVKKFKDKIAFLLDIRNNTKVKPLDGFERASISNIYVSGGKYHITCNISASFQDSDHSCTYQKETIYIGDVVNNWTDKGDNGSLEKINEFTPLPMLSPAKEWAKYVKAAKAKEAFENATNAMFYGLREWVR